MQPTLDSFLIYSTDGICHSPQMTAPSHWENPNIAHHGFLCDFEGTGYECHFVYKISLSDCTSLEKFQQNKWK